MMTNESGQTVWTGEYLPFGEQLSITGSITNNLRFPGQYYDSETGLHQNWHRDYRKETGTYLQADLVGQPMMNLNVASPSCLDTNMIWLVPAFINNPQNLHPFVYVGSNSINLTDPEGLFWPIDCGKCIYYRNKLQKATDKCRSKSKEKCKTLEDDVQFYEGQNSTGYGSAIWNCVKSETGDPNIWSKITTSCFKCTFLLTGPKPPLPKRLPQ